MKFLLWRIFLFWIIMLLKYKFCTDEKYTFHKISTLIKNKSTNLISEIPPDIENDHHKLNILTTDEKPASEFFQENNKLESVNPQLKIIDEGFKKKFRDFKISLDLANQINQNSEGKPYDNDKYLYPNNFPSKKVSNDEEEEKRNVINHIKTIINNYSGKSVNKTKEFKIMEKMNLNKTNGLDKIKKIVLRTNYKSAVNRNTQRKFNGFLSLIDRNETETDRLDLLDLKPDNFYVGSVFDDFHRKEKKEIKDGSENDHKNNNTSIKQGSKNKVNKESHQIDNLKNDYISEFHKKINIVNKNLNKNHTKITKITNKTKEMRIINKQEKYNSSQISIKNSKIQDDNIKIYKNSSNVDEILNGNEKYKKISLFENKSYYVLKEELLMLRKNNQELKIQDDKNVKKMKNLLENLKKQNNEATELRIKIINLEEKLQKHKVLNLKLKKFINTGRNITELKDEKLRIILEEIKKVNSKSINSINTNCVKSCLNISFDDKKTHDFDFLLKNATDFLRKYKNDISIYKRLLNEVRNSKLEKQKQIHKKNITKIEKKSKNETLLKIGFLEKKQNEIRPSNILSKNSTILKKFLKNENKVFGNKLEINKLTSSPIKLNNRTNFNNINLMEQFKKKILLLEKKLADYKKTNTFKLDQEKNLEKYKFDLSSCNFKLNKELEIKRFLEKNTNEIKNNYEHLKTLTKALNQKFSQNKKLLQNRVNEIVIMEEKLKKCNEQSLIYRHIVDSNLVLNGLSSDSFSTNFISDNSDNSDNTNKFEGFSFKSVKDDITFDEKNSDVDKTLTKKQKFSNGKIELNNKINKIRKNSGKIGIQYTNGSHQDKNDKYSSFENAETESLKDRMEKQDNYQFMFKDTKTKDKLSDQRNDLDVKSIFNNLNFLEINSKLTSKSQSNLLLEDENLSDDDPIMINGDLESEEETQNESDIRKNVLKYMKLLNEKENLGVNSSDIDYRETDSNINDLEKNDKIIDESYKKRADILKKIKDLKDENYLNDIIKTKSRISKKLNKMKSSIKIQTPPNSNLNKDMNNEKKKLEKKNNKITKYKLINESSDVDDIFGQGSNPNKNIKKKQNFNKGKFNLNQLSKFAKEILMDESVKQKTKSSKTNYINENICWEMLNNLMWQKANIDNIKIDENIIYEEK